MERRNESAVYFEQKIRARGVEELVAALRDRGVRASVLHVVIWAIAQTLHDRPRLNRFVAGGRIYQRRGIWISFSAKKAKDDAHPIIALKREVDPAWGLEALVAQIEAAIGEGRSDRRSATDRELGLIFLLPTFLVRAVVRLEMLLDRWGLLPRAFIESDPLYSSVMVANLGSLDMDAPFHHLYEYGTISIFVSVGRTQPELAPSAGGSAEVVPMITMRYTFDERIEDGLYCLRALERFKVIVEDPARALREHAEQRAQEAPSREPSTSDARRR